MSTNGLARHAPSAFSKVAIRFAFPRTLKARQNLGGSEFADKAAHFLAELNAIHAFREGNGRSQLTFFALLADYAGHPIDLEELDPDKMLEAMVVSFDGDETKLANIIKSLIR
jgi:cell filamentation protein